MGDSMDEELERGGVSIARAPGPLAFSNGYQHPQQQLAAQVEVAVATDHQRQQQQQQQQQQPMAVWPGKRERNGEENSSMDSFIPMMGASGALGRESPDSEMSSSSGSGGSDRSINRGIKRMRLNNQQQQQQQQHPDCLHQHEQQQQQPQQQQHQGHHPLSAFDRFSPSSSAATSVLATTTLHHPRPLTLGRAASSASTHDALPTQAVQRSSSGGGTLHPAGGAPSGQQQRSQSFDSCVAFPPFPPRPPAQARYVRGIRVEADAPSDVDYSNVNHALRQLHMERRMMAAARGGGSSSSRRRRR
ncbi:unnamed protein product, partial [Ectocarpus sp. 6 AP-2014]